MSLQTKVSFVMAKAKLPGWFKEWTTDEFISYLKWYGQRFTAN